MKIKCLFGKSALFVAFVMFLASCKKDKQENKTFTATATIFSMTSPGTSDDLTYTTGGVIATTADGKKYTINANRLDAGVDGAGQVIASSTDIVGSNAAFMPPDVGGVLTAITNAPANTVEFKGSGYDITVEITPETRVSLDDEKHFEAYKNNMDLFRANVINMAEQMTSHPMRIVVQ